MSPNQTVLDVLLELQTLDRIPRAGYFLRGVPDCESVAEHSFHLVFLVWALGPRVEGLDVPRALELSLLHDLAEVRFGDLPRTAAHYLPEGAKKQAERAALADLLRPLGERGDHARAEYEAAETLEARFVQACDRLQLLLKVAVYERWGTGDLSEFWRRPDRFDDGGFEVVRETYEQLLASRR